MPRRAVAVVGLGVMTALLGAPAPPAWSLPPPNRDLLGDNIRSIEWDTALPIPGLSRFATRWIRTAKLRPIPKYIADQAYAERAARIADLASSDEVAELLGVRTGVDILAALPGRIDGPVVAFEQRYRAAADDQEAIVTGAHVAFFIGADGVSISGILSGFQPGIAPPHAELSADEATAMALETMAELGAPPLELLSVPTLTVERKPLRLAGVRPPSVVRRVNDRPYYPVQLFNPRAELDRVQVDIDAVTGEQLEVHPLSSHGSLHQLGTARK